MTDEASNCLLTSTRQNKWQQSTDNFTVSRALLRPPGLTPQYVSPTASLSSCQVSTASSTRQFIQSANTRAAHTVVSHALLLLLSFNAINRRVGLNLTNKLETRLTYDLRVQQNQAGGAESPCVWVQHKQLSSPFCMCCTLIYSPITQTNNIILARRQVPREC